LKQTCVAKHGSLAFLPTDWATAFDGISPDSLIVALWRVSVQNNFCPRTYTGRWHAPKPSPQISHISKISILTFPAFTRDDRAIF